MQNQDDPNDKNILDAEFADPAKDPDEDIDHDISKDPVNQPLDPDEIKDDQLNTPLSPAEAGEEDMSGSAPDAEPADIDEQLGKLGLEGDSDDDPQPLGVGNELADEEK